MDRRNRARVGVAAKEQRGSIERPQTLTDGRRGEDALHVSAKLPRPFAQCIGPSAKAASAPPTRFDSAKDARKVDAGRLDLAGVDRGLLFRLGRTGKIGKEAGVGAVGLAVHDALAGERGEHGVGDGVAGEGLVDGVEGALGELDARGRGVRMDLLGA